MKRPRLTPPLPLLITGVSGVPGYNALPYFRRRFPGQVVGVRQRDNWKLRGPDIVACDAEDRDGLLRLFDQYEFRAVLNCAGNCALKACELDPELACRINVGGVINLLDAIADRPVRLVHLSVDMVYSGVGPGGYIESAPVDPVNMYGKTMVMAEQVIAERKLDAAVLRISLPMGVSFNGHAGAIDWIQSRFRKSRPATLYYDEIRTPIYTDCLNRLCRAVLARPDLQGLFHAAAPRAMSVYQVGQVINRVGGYDPELLMGCPRVEAGPIPPRAGNIALDSSKLAAALGYPPLDPWPFDERFVPTHDQWHFEREVDEPGSFELLSRILYRNPRRRKAEDDVSLLGPAT
ncbi:MAG: sugar nucleotide-binding protein [Planctomycetes bacterium]|nr:sugar nucleotide-binding protein [Planctomycetota bacterium]